MKRIPHIGLDIETLSLRPTAAITAIAAKTFFFDGTTDEERSLNCCVDATSCAMYGLSIEQQTVDWWASRPEEAKRYFLDTPAVKLKDALLQLTDLYRSVQRDYDCQRVLVWVQGSDFDISILRNAYYQVFGDAKNFVCPHDRLRDARTYILSNLSLLNAAELLDGYNPDRPYDIIPPKRDGWVKHNADSDVMQMIHNVCYVNNLLREQLSR